MKKINFEKKKIIPLANKTGICYICKKELVHKHANDEKYCEVREHCYYTGKYKSAGHITCNLK